MTVTDELLVQLADGVLDTTTAEAVRDALAGDPEAAERYRLMKLSGDALMGAVEPDPVPDTRLAAAIRSGALDAAETPPDQAGNIAQEVPAAHGAGAAWPVSQLQLAASIAILAVGLLAGYWISASTGDRDATVIAGQPTWIVRVVDYHTLYGRETVTPSKITDAEVALLQNRFERALKTPVLIPDLQSRNLEFRRGQVLRFKDAPIIQLAYLPKADGLPIALCLRTTSEADSQPAYVKLRGLGVVRWRLNGLDYVLVGERGKDDLLADAQSAISEISAAGAT